MKTPQEIAEEIKRLADEIIGQQEPKSVYRDNRTPITVEPHPAPELSFLTGEWLYVALYPEQKEAINAYSLLHKHAEKLRTALAKEFEKQTITREAK